MAAETRERQKFCAGCASYKDRTEFFRRTDSKCGLRSKCKSCFRANDVAWALANPDTYREANRKSTASWYQRNREKGRRIGMENARKFARESPRAYLLRCARDRARKSGVPFSITIDDILIPTHCPVLGFELTPFQGLVDGHRLETTPSLDKIIPSLGYVSGNVRVISLRANRLKQDATLGELLALVEYMEGRR